MSSLWTCLIRINGGGGYSLSHVAPRGYDAMRMWICNLIVWHSATLGSSSTTVCSSLDTALLELESILAKYNHNHTLLTTNEISYLLRGLRVVQQRAIGSSEYLKQLHLHSAASNGISSSVGSCIPLSCGHNGWPSDAALALLTNKIRNAGFTI